MRTFTIFLLSLFPCLAQVIGDQKEALAQALYTEEVTRDSEAAAAQYQKIVEAHRRQRVHAATALFRLAEIRRVQGKAEAATALYQEYLSAFSDLEPQAKLARKQLAEVGASPEGRLTVPTDEEAKNLQRLKRFAISAPDVVTDPEELFKAVTKNQLSVIDFLLSQKSDPLKTDSLRVAAQRGYLEVVKRLLDHNPKVPKEVAAQTLFSTYKSNRTAVLNYLLDQGFTTEITVDGKRGPSLLMLACRRNDRPTIEMLVERGADIDWNTTSEVDYSVISPLHTAIFLGHFDLATYLIEKGAKATYAGAVNETAKNVTPLHLAAISNSPAAVKLVKLLIQKGADPDQRLKGKGLPILPASGVRPLPPGMGGGAVFRSDVKTALEAASTPEMIRALVKGGATLDPVHLLKKGKDLELLQCLLDLGAAPNAPSPTYGGEHTVFSELIHIRRSRSHSALTRAHLEAFKKAGAVIPPNQFKNQDPLDFVNRKIRDDVFDIFVLPTLSKPNSITLLDAHSRKTVRIASPRPLPTSLVLTSAISIFHANSPELDDPFSDGSPGRGPLYNPQIKVARASGNFILDLNAQEVPTALKFGDVLTLTRIEDDKSSESGFPGQVRWNLLKTIDFKVRFIEEGRSRTVSIRGDRLVSSSDGLIQPYLHGRELVNRLSSKIHPPLEIKLARANGETTSLGNDARDFHLLPGDTIEVTRHASIDTFDPTKITLYTSGSSFRSILELNTPGSPVPSLCEYLAASIPSQTARDLAMLAQNPDKFAAAQIEATLQVPPSFDLSQIKILRRKGTTLVEIKIDLEAKIKSLPDDPTQGDLRQLDPQLYPGDVIEVATRPVEESTKGSIFTPEVSTFFEKLFQGSVKIHLENRKKAFATLSWSSPKVHLTPFGPIAFLPEAERQFTVGDILPRYTHGSGAYFGFSRGSSSHKVHLQSNFPLRDGDQINATGPSVPGAPPRPGSHK